MLLMFVVMPRLRRAKTHVRGWVCLNNLHQQGLAFKTWELDNQDRYPQQVPAADGGAMESARAAQLPFVFQVMSNELNTPKILACPMDLARTAACSFESNLLNTNLSYFVGVDASDSRTNTFLSGDRNLTRNGMALQPGRLHVLRTNAPTGWTSEIHKTFGYILLVDGSAHEFTGSNLTAFLQTNCADTNRIAIP